MYNSGSSLLFSSLVSLLIYHADHGGHSFIPVKQVASNTPNVDQWQVAIEDQMQTQVLESYHKATGSK